MKMIYIHSMNETFSLPGVQSISPRRPLGANLANVDLNLLVSLHALLEEESVTSAARRVGLSQPAMSHALRRIRKLFDDQILVRQGGGSVLTPRARELLGPLRELLRQTSRLLGEEEFIPEHSRRAVTIAMSTSMAFLLGRVILKLLEESAPHMELEIITTDEIGDAVFTDHGVDLLLLAEGYPTSHPRERLFDDEWVVIGGVPELLEGDAISKLQDWPHVALESERMSRGYEVLRHRGVAAKVQVRVNDYLLLPQYVSGMRKIALHRRRVMEVMEHGEPLYWREFPFPILGLGVDMVWNPWLREEKFRGWFRELLFRACDIQFVNGDN
ncbi:Nodulation protein D 2 [Corynebacterium occultum]|uniref:Nodulation protein D 2 n=2 Tax=Corynebacterium occultum TaxID=2675219 RepID=A0A6B8VQS1_9CORY|nr:Nodulation protein D 2 [Corynebacterium occultum]